ncbi:myosin head-domain-containing protein [Chytriomyces sp. MP71]|nr:myosin head-domain-containing protein [Chytriomyces sp. MP71]KAI8615320.1 myosin head-domain-containing protein [Chytriomyces sp. MP71]
MVRSCKDQVILSCPAKLRVRVKSCSKYCFGNAKTFQTKDSRRYSRYTEVRFNNDRTVVGSRIEEYLFEDSRVSKCPDDEHTFYIFYIMLQRTSREDRIKWKLHSQETRAYQFCEAKVAFMTSQFTNFSHIGRLKVQLKRFS